MADRHSNQLCDDAGERRGLLLPLVRADEYDVLPGDIYLLCSDGLNDMVPDDEISMSLAEKRSLGADGGSYT